MWDSLPLNMLGETLQYLPARDIVMTAGACRFWQQINSCKALWQTVAKTNCKGIVFPSGDSKRGTAIRVAKLLSGYSIIRGPFDSKPNLKIVITGGRLSGVSSLLDRFVYEQQEWPVSRNNYSDLTFRSFQFYSAISQRSVGVRVVDMRDTVSPSPYPNTTLFCGSTALLIAIDRSSEESLIRAKQILTAFRRYLAANFDSLPIALLGTKSDQSSSFLVPLREIHELMNEYNAPYFETSAFAGRNLDAPFVYLSKRMCHLYA